MNRITLLLFTLLMSCNTHNHSISELQFNSELGLISTEHAIKDLHYLFQKLEVVHYNPYLHISKEKLSEHINLIKSNWQQRDSLMRADFIIQTMKLLSKIEDAHTALVWYSTEVLNKRDDMSFFPLQMKINAENAVYITDAFHSQYKGEEVRSINGLNANSLYTEALECLSSNFEHKNELTSSLFFPVFLYLKGISAPYSIDLESNQKIQIDSTESATFLDLYKRIQTSQLNYEFTLLEAEKIALISYNSCTDYEAFKLFLETTFQEIAKHKISDLIIDIRNNSGGNSALNDLLFAYITNKKYRQSSKRFWKLSDVSIEELNTRDIAAHYGENFVRKYRLKRDTSILLLGEDEAPKSPEKVDHYFSGNTYVLIGSKTFSSANMFADAVATYDLCPLIGMPTGERTNDFGEQKTAILPHSKIPFDFTIAFDIGADGNEMNIKTVEPDIKVREDALGYTINLILKKRKNAR